jgi:TolB-like protein/Tfp pilus assembly protein PilF
LPQEQRRLAAILAADVVGFSRLMEADEAGTLAALKARRSDVLDPLVATHKGRIFKTTGDGVLIEFASAVNALQCAVDLQQAMAAANAGMAPDKQIILRVGVNLGDVMVAGSDLYGDGVNIAARLEALADPGGIAVSGTAYEHVGSKISVHFVDLGPQTLKNIARPIQVYRVETVAPQGKVAKAPTDASAPASSGKVSIAVLPFDNMSGDPEQQYFSDGIAEDIITGLSRFRELLVIARNSSFTFRGKNIDIKDVAQKLGVQFVVEGSVRKIGNRVRVTVQLIEAASSAHVWAERYDRDLTDIFEIQDEITRMVTSRVAGHAISAATQRIRARPTENLSAYDYYLKAREFSGMYDAALQVEVHVRKSIELDPDFAMPYALLGVVHVVKYFYEGNSAYLEEALRFGQRALKLDSEEPWACYAVAMALTNMRRQSEAGHYIERAIDLNPSNAEFLAYHAMWMCYVGQSDGAIPEIDEALRRDPYSVDWYGDVRGIVMTAAGKPREAIESFSRMKALAPWSLCYIAICHVELGEIVEAQACLAKYKALNPPISAEEMISNEPFVDKAKIQHFVDALRRAAGAEAA